MTRPPGRSAGERGRTGSLRAASPPHGHDGRPATQRENPGPPKPFQRDRSLHAVTARSAPPAVFAPGRRRSCCPPSPQPLAPDPGSCRAGASAAACTPPLLTAARCTPVTTQSVTRSPVAGPRCRCPQCTARPKRSAARPCTPDPSPNSTPLPPALLLLPPTTAAVWGAWCGRCMGPPPRGWMGRPSGKALGGAEGTAARQELTPPAGPCVARRPRPGGAWQTPARFPAHCRQHLEPRSRHHTPPRDSPARVFSLVLVTDQFDTCGVPENQHIACVSDFQSITCFRFS